MDKHKGAGHRGRLRQRFLNSGLNGFLDYEIIELLLTLGTPRKDCKQMAKDAIKKFGNINNVFNASILELQSVKGIGPSNVFGLKLFQAISEYISKIEIPKNVTLDSTQVIANFLQKHMGNEKKEFFVMLSLNTRKNLIKISNISIGTLNMSVVHPREVFKEAIQQSAAQIILAHNHPSNDPQPSPEDIAITRRLEEVANILGIDLLDHIIVTNNQFVSMRESNLL